MCGLAGIVDTSGRKSRAELCSAVHAMAGALCHRGPDDAGEWIDDRAGLALGFRRLSIIDLSAAGHQPMVAHDGRFVLVFNGEVYNHEALRRDLAASGIDAAWSGHADSETLLACVGAWGVKAALERTVGMFALLLWDRQERVLHLARDRFGEKPLYYGWTGDVFVAGSELSALQRHPGFGNEIDRDVLDLYMQFGCVPAPYSIYRNIWKLEPGCVLSIAVDAAVRPAAPLFAPARLPGLTLERYWSLTDVARRGLEQPIDDDEEAVEQLEQALREAVRLQSIADVPLGAFLSGGIDSSAIVALMQAQSPRPVKTFTIGFSEEAFNEAPHAKAVAQHLGTDHTELYLSAEQAREVIPALPQLYSEPFADSSQIPTHLVSRVARQQVTVALSGDGGDEMFGGYTRYAWAPRLWRRYGVLPAAVRSGVAVAMERIPACAWDTMGAITPGGGVARLGEKAQKLAHRLRRAHNLDELYKGLATIWPAGSTVVAGARPLPTRLEAAIAETAGLDPVARMMIWDTLTYLPDDILHKVDRASMGVSLETRAPFLDHRVAEVAWRLPLRMKLRDGRGKWILRQLLYRYVPPALVERPKMGFAVPIDAWLRGPLREWAEALLGESRLRAEGYFNPALVRGKWTEHLSGARDWQHELWAVLMFQSWQEAHA